MNIDAAIEKRRSIRDFSSKKVRWSQVLEAIDAAIKAPFAGNINHLQFVIVSDQKIKNEIATQSQQLWLSEASYIVVICSDSKHLESLYNDRGKAYAKQQAGAAIENFLLKIVDMGLASCWVGAYLDERIKDCLDIPDNMEIEALLPVSYPDKIKKTKVPRRARLENVIHWGNWGTRKKPAIFTDPVR